MSLAEVARTRHPALMMRASPAGERASWSRSTPWLHRVTAG